MFLSRFRSQDPAKVFSNELTLALIRFAAVFIVAGGLIATLWTNINREASNLSALRGERQRIIESFDALARLNVDSKEAAELLLIMEAALPNPLEISIKAIPQIRRAAQDRNVNAAVEVGSFSPLSEAEPANVKLTIRADGSAENLIGFVIALEKEKLAVRFDAVEINPLGSAGVFQAILSGKLYLR